MKTIACMVGTRPEAIKMAPVIAALKAEPWCRPYVVATAQHRSLMDQVLNSFNLGADVDLDVMKPDQSLAELTARLITKVDACFENIRPDLVLAQGDTTTVFSTALVAFYRNIPFGHVEAGLRTGDLMNPFPEEFNRLMASRVARWHFAPTEAAQSKLLAEGYLQDSVYVTGNTVIDALKWAAKDEPRLPVSIGPDRRLLLLTVHRRESFGAPLRSIFCAIQKLLSVHQDIEIVYPVHLNPNVNAVAREMLAGLPRLHLIEPLAYPELVACLTRCTLVLTDSGGLQEEAPALGKPVVVLRHTTERPEAVACGAAVLVGTCSDAIVAATSRLLLDPDAYRSMASAGSPYGDGHAAARIVEVLRRDMMPG